MATPSTTADRARRLSRLVDAAVLLPAPARRQWVDRACGGDAAMRLEAETLVACHAELTALDPDRRERLSELFHAARGLPPDHRGQYLDLACEGDANAAVAQLALTLLSGQPTHNTDFLEPLDESSIIVTHCGSGSFSVCTRRSRPTWSPAFPAAHRRRARWP